MIRVLMVGYNGANNTGAEALLASDIEDVRAVLGAEAHITVPSLNPVNLRRYLAESPTLRIEALPTLFFGAISRMVKESDLVLLVEGSTYMDTWGSPLLWAYLWATHCAARMGKPCLAYAVDAGTLKPANARLVRRVASRTDLIVTRTRAAAGRLRAVGVTAPIESTADNAFTFQPRETDRGWVAREWPRAAGGVVGLAMVDFTLFPAVMRPWGSKKLCYKWPYYFCSSPERTRSSEMLVRGYAALADHVIERTGKAVALISMEQLDEGMAERVHQRMRHPESARRFSARVNDASRMTCLLRDLDLLVTSRFHAAVLSLAAGVPQVAVHHDTRLATLYEDLGLKEKWFLEPGAAGSLAGGFAALKLFKGLRERVDQLLGNPGQQRDALERGYAEHLGLARLNRELLDWFVTDRGLDHASSTSRLDAVFSNVNGDTEWVA
ncbi:MAG TPA: polysaccharide pyruvyl transferase family protein [Desulfobacterales bacterium]|nr:polysaccharide pyruvyl transferase family protein [Desulfobacterales bacterium]